jgi:ribosomal protein S9
MMNVWKNTMNPNIFNPPPNAKYIKSIYVDSKVNIGGLIGQKGVVFNAITKASIGMMYIWYNNESRMVEMYGDDIQGIMYATRKINERIERII